MNEKSGHWTNTGLTKWINNNLYNYDENDEKSMNPKKWYDINNGGNLNDTRECIYGFPCRLILVNDGTTPLNEGQNEPTPGNTKDMGIFNFNHDKDATDTMGFDTDVFPNCASYEVTANSDTSAGAFMSYHVEDVYSIDCTFYTTTNYTFILYETPITELGMEKGNEEILITSSDFTQCRISYRRINGREENITVSPNTPCNLSVQDIECISIVVLDRGVKNLENTQLKINGRLFKCEKVLDVNALDVIIPYKSSTSESPTELEYIKQSFELRFPDEDDVSEDWGFMGIPGEEGTGLKALIDWVDGCTDEEFVRDFEQHFNKDYTLRYFLLVITLGMVDNLG